VTNLRIAILVSGNGSVVRTLLRACQDGRIAGEVVAVAADIECPALKLAEDASVETVGFRHLDQYESRAARDTALAELVRGAEPSLVVVGGYANELEKNFFEAVGADVIGMYPAVLPAFGELPEAIGPALDYGVKLIGVTIHYRTPLTGSTGPIIAQEPLPVDHTDTVEGVTERVIALESEFLPRVIGLIAEGRVERDGSTVRVV
jgi:phosphoribosylglycinamide formyltransferase-1